MLTCRPAWSSLLAVRTTLNAQTGAWLLHTCNAPYFVSGACPRVVRRQSDTHVFTRGGILRFPHRAAIISQVPSLILPDLISLKILVALVEQSIAGSVSMPAGQNLFFFLPSISSFSFCILVFWWKFTQLITGNPLSVVTDLRSHIPQNSLYQTVICVSIMSMNSKEMRKVHPFTLWCRRGHWDITDTSPSFAGG